LPGKRVRTLPTGPNLSTGLYRPGAKSTYMAKTAISTHYIDFLSINCWFVRAMAAKSKWRFWRRLGQEFGLYRPRPSYPPDFTDRSRDIHRTLPTEAELSTGLYRPTKLSTGLYRPKISSYPQKMAKKKLSTGLYRPKVGLYRPDSSYPPDFTGYTNST
jgi:hypothetical protein